MDRNIITDLYLEQEPVPRLHLGSADNYLAGWLNTDLMPHNGYGDAGQAYVFMDAAKPFPLPDNAFLYVYTEHMIEHLSWIKGARMLTECARVLQPGGKIRIATPNLAVLLDLYRPDKSPIQEQYIAWIAERFLPNVEESSDVMVINNAFRSWGHQFIYDESFLTKALIKAGFQNVVACDVGKSSDPYFDQLERHGIRVGNEEMNVFETMVLEAKLPA
ncbi:MAG: methyltransferase domain-containing protein [Bacteroidota bacterium]